MWIRKSDRDRKKGVDSPMPTQVLSNEEFIPRPQSQKQKQVEHLIGQMAEEKSKKLGMDRRTFMASAMGMATCFVASNRVWGRVWEVDEAETMDRKALAMRRKLHGNEHPDVAFSLHNLATVFFYQNKLAQAVTRLRP